MVTLWVMLGRLTRILPSSFYKSKRKQEVSSIQYVRKVRIITLRILLIEYEWIYGGKRVSHKDTYLYLSQIHACIDACQCPSS